MIEDIKKPLDIINVFRNPFQIVSHVNEAIRVKPKVFWMQLNIVNYEAAELLSQAGIYVVMNRCIKMEHERLF